MKVFAFIILVIFIASYINDRYQMSQLNDLYGSWGFRKDFYLAIVVLIISAVVLIVV